MVKLIERESVTRNYGMGGTNAIVESNGERYLITDGFGGQDSISGGMVRWRHGMVIKLQPNED